MGDQQGPLDAAEMAPSRRQEIAAFLVTTFVIFPGLTVAFVGTYGLVIWLSQMVLGPPGPPA